MTRVLKSAALSFFFTLCLTAAFITHRLHTRPRALAPRELFAAVSNQVTAIRRANFATAYGQSSNDVQQKFTLPQFEQMVRRQYSQLGKGGRIEFGRVDVDELNAIVEATIVTGDGLAESFEFALVAEGESWKVSGVRAIGLANQRQRAIGLRL